MDSTEKHNIWCERNKSICLTCRSQSKDYFPLHKRVNTKNTYSVCRGPEGHTISANKPYVAPGHQVGYQGYWCFYFSKRQHVTVFTSPGTEENFPICSLHGA